MSFGSDKTQAKPVFADAQRDVRDDVFRQLLFPQAFGGAPDAGFERGVERGREGLTETLATQGLTGSGLAAKAATDLEAKAVEGRDQNRMSVIDRILSPLGQQSSGNGVLHLGK